MSARNIEHAWITLSDGTRLAARMWLPEASPSPAVLEYIPYRKRDGTRARDEPMHGYFAAQGYACVRVDMRGSGDSDGLLDDEYLLAEQDDGVEVIAWIAAQPWCDGAVGMMGKSWGGFNALQIAARRPPALRAIITVCSTDDRYADDIHYMGGCLLTDNLWWGAIMLAYQARPPDPQTRGDDWREVWLARLEHMPFWPALWMAHQRRDAYWRRGSVCEAWDAIACPVLVVGGWADAYTSAVPRLLAGLKVPRRGVIGPWAHLYPHDGVPGPAIGFLQEATRWWDHWLRGRDTGVMSEPLLRAYLQEHAEPATTRPHAPGRWVGSVWPPSSPPTLLYPDGRLLSQQQAAAESVAQIISPGWTGMAAGAWMGTGIAGEAPGDQRGDDALSLVFDTEPLSAPLEILGAPVLELALSSDQPWAQVAARLCDVASDGSSLRVSYGVLNLARRDGMHASTPMPAGHAVKIRIALKACGHRFALGHRIRLSLSTSYWPTIWPAPAAATLTLRLCDSRLVLPGFQDEASLAPTFPPTAHGPFAAVASVRAGTMRRDVTFDQINATVMHQIGGAGGVFGEGVFRFEDIDTLVDHGIQRRLTIGSDPLSAEDNIAQYYELGRDRWDIRIETNTTLTADSTHFKLSGQMTVRENGKCIHARHWDERFERDGV